MYGKNFILQVNLMSKKTLIFGPWIGELGHEVATWVPAMRYVAQRFNNVIAVCEPKHEFLYKDFITDFYNYRETGKKDRWLCGGYKPKSLEIIMKDLMEKYPHAVYYKPSYDKCMKWPRKYKKYGEKRDNCVYDIVIHARSFNNNDWIDKDNGGSRNWPKENYERVVEAFQGRNICSIGSNSGAYHIKNTKDCRDIPLKDLSNILASSKICIGTSSGAMHFAQMCGCPILVWTDDKLQKSILATNKVRYEKLWNPKFAGVSVIDEFGWKPPVDVIIEALRREDV